MKKWVLLMFAVILAGCSGDGMNEEERSSEFPPNIDAYVVVDGGEHEMDPGGFEWHRKKGFATESIRTDHASVWQMSERMDAIRIHAGSTITFKIEGDPEMAVYLWDENGRQVEVILDDGKLPLPIEEGRYVYEVDCTWDNGNQFFAFILERIF